MARERYNPVVVEDTASLDLTKTGSVITGDVLAPGIDHGALAGLGDDDHTQYALLAGRAGGQELIGGIAAGEDMTLRSTSNATKGVIKADNETVRMKRILAGGVT